MATKLQYYSELAERHARQVTRGRKQWTGYLDTAARLYKYPFSEQLMIYAQRPDATACASIETWNDPMHRWVRRGSKGIALLDDSGDAPRLKYVFDVADTEPGRRNARNPYLWALREDHESPVLEALAKTYGDMEGSLPAVLHGIAGQLAQEYYNDNAREIGRHVEGSFLEEVDEFNVGVSFRMALTVSVAYTLMTRCGIDANAHFDDEDFQPIFDFNTPGAVYCLGAAASALSQQVLREIEVTVKNYERQHAAERGTEHEQADLYQSRGLPDARYSAAGVAGGRAAAGQIRPDAQTLSQGTPANVVPFPTAARRAVPTPAGDRADGERTAGANDDRAGGTEPAAREVDRSGGMDGAHEQPAPSGGGSDTGRTDIRIGEIEPEIEAQTETPPAPMPGGVIVSEALAGSSITVEDVDTVLRDGGNQKNSALRIAAFYMKDKPPDENAAFLAREYQSGGKGFQMGAAQVSVWFDGTGLTLGRGKSALNASDRVHLSWEQAAARVRDLMETGQYLPRDIMSLALDKERQELAERLWYFYRDDVQSMPEAWNANGSGFPDSVATIRSLIEQPDQLAAIAHGLEAYINALRSADPSPRLWHDPDQLLRDIQDCRIPPRAFPAGELSSPGFMPFITEDEIDTALAQGSATERSKHRIYSYFQNEHTPRERADFLKDEYGTGGKTHALSGADNSYEDHGTKGITLRRGPMSNPHDTVTLSWARVAARIDALIRDGRYMSGAELERIPEYEPNVQPSNDEVIAETSPVPSSPGLEQLSLFSITPQPPLPTVEAQRKIVEDAIARSEENYPQPMPDTERHEAPFPADNRTYIVGDTVYLENDKPYIIEHIDYDVRLKDASLRYPILRSESREHFEQLLRQNPLNRQFTDFIGSSILNEAAQLGDMSEPARATHEQSSEGLPDETEPPQTPVNFRISDEHLGEGGPKTKYGYNAAAIRTLKQIEAEGRAATPYEQETLSRYVGWGGIPQAFDADNKGWTREYAELRELLTPDEYELARASTLNAHYTSPTVIRAIYDVVERMGFTSGNILEPACGTGNFFGLLPDSMQNAKLYGVELDSITGRIAAQLYPQANIAISGYEKTDMTDSFFDLAIGNVPFGNYQVADKRYDKHNFLIHDYFFARTLDQVRPGGVVAFITSKGTLDKQNLEVRKYIAQRAELLGAVRLPNDAFLKNAGTEVTTDILFLQKRDRLMDIGLVDDTGSDWVHLGLTADDIPVNSYFANHPEMVLGTMAYDDSMYGNAKETTCKPISGADLAQQLRVSLANIRGQIAEAELDDVNEPRDASVPADPSVRNFSYTLVDDALYYRENSRMYPVNLPSATMERVRGMVAMRDCVHELIACQLDDHGDDAIAAKQAELNTLYDAFTAEHGLINTSANSRAFSDDSAYYLLCSLEILDENGDLERKADMFTKRTIKQKTVVTSVDTASEALAVSIAERASVDMGFMQSLTGFTEEKLIADLQGVIFRDLGETDPANVPMAFYDLEKRPFATADAYLSGNVRQKLRLANSLAEARPDLAKQIAPNIAALELAQPKDLEAGEISVRLGSTWVDKRYIQQFTQELLKLPFYVQNAVQVNYSEHTGEWNISGKTRIPANNVLANVTYGTGRMNAAHIIEETLNLRDVRVYDTVIEDGKEKRVLNKRETTLAQQKQEAIKQAFKDWIFTDPERRQTLVALYNERFNSVRPREYDGSHINFSGISPDITLRPHQLNAIAHVLYGGNTLLAHEVGAGKTFEMVAAAMESKRLGLCRKSLFAVPNHLTEQWASEFLRLYPSANILVATKKDFETRNRKKFCARIVTGDYDAVILGHSQLEKIPLSDERQERQLKEQLWEVMQGIDELQESRGERFTIKQLEKTKKSLEARLQKLADGKRKDDVVTFEQLGVDRLFVDEAHAFKNLFLYTKMRNVAGLSQTEAQKSSDLFMKCRYLDELTAGSSGGGGKGIIFATGTPISNSMTELFTMQRYLQYGALEKNRLTHFDAWASTFGETVTAIELAPEGTGYRARTRFAKFHNLPELMCMFREVADIKTADTLNLPRPKANFHTVVVEPTQLQRELVAELSERAAAVHANTVDASTDNMLKITSDGRKIGLDQRLMNPMLPDDPGSKVNSCMENVYRIWRDTAPERLTQLLFCDFSTPNADGRFNVYDDIRAKLVERGIPEGEIAFIHEANTEVRKKELFAKVRQGKVRVLMGSTFKMGSGTNVQDRLIALHDLDCPWRPSDLEQRGGRIVRQGNINPEVEIYRYVTEATFDAYLFQTVENKQKFISQIMTSKSPVRACEDVDETALSYAEIKALCVGDDRIKEKMQLDIDVAQLRLLKADHQSQHFRLEDNLMRYYPESIESAKTQIAGYERDIARLAEHTPAAPDAFPTMVVHGVAHAEKDKAGAALLEACKSVTSIEPVHIGSFRGMDMHLAFDALGKQYRLSLKGDMRYGTDLGPDVFGNLTRIQNVLADLPARLNAAKAQLENLHQQQAEARLELQSPFQREAELTEKTERLAYLDAALNMDGGRSEHTSESDVGEPERVTAKSAKPSVLEGLRTDGDRHTASDRHTDKPAVRQTKRTELCM